jgi:hypothetical protein
LSGVRHQRNAIREKIAEKIHANGQKQPQIEAVSAANEFASPEQQPAQQAQKQDCFDRIHTSTLLDALFSHWVRLAGLHPDPGAEPNETG